MSFEVPAGIFIPSMAIGACFGRALGVFFEILQSSYPQSFFFASCVPDVPCITPGTYAMIGAASVLGGVTRMTGTYPTVKFYFILLVTVAVIMFELTGALNYVLPIMIALLVSKAVGDFISKTSLYGNFLRHVHLRTFQQ